MCVFFTTSAHVHLSRAAEFHPLQCTAATRPLRPSTELCRNSSRNAGMCSGSKIGTEVEPPFTHQHCQAFFAAAFYGPTCPTVLSRCTWEYVHSFRKPNKLFINKHTQRACTSVGHADDSGEEPGREERRQLSRSSSRRSALRPKQNVGL